MNISFLETFKKVTSVTLIFGLVFSTLTPAAFAAVGATFVATETVANEAFGATTETVTHTDITANVIEVKATRTIDVQSLPANNSTIKIGTCTITFQSISGSTSDELDCSDDAATIDRNTGSGNNNRTASSIAGRIRALTNIGSTNHGTLVVSGSGTEAIFTTSASFIENTASAIGFSGTAAGVSVLSTNSVSSVIPVKQETSITIGGTVDVGDTFTVTSAPFGTASFVATTTSTSDVATGLNAAIQAHPNYPTRNYTTSVAGNVITLTAKTAGTGFTTLTPTTTNFPGTAQVVTFTPANIVSGMKFTVTINGSTFTTGTTTIGSSAASVVTELASLIVEPGVTCTDNITYLSCTSNTPGTPFTYSTSLQDVEKPVISLNGSNPVNVQVYGIYNEAGATALDNYDTGLVVTNITGTVDTSTVGKYYVYYDITDASGNIADQVARIVNVIDQENPSTTDNVPASWQTTDTTVTLTCTDNVACDKAYYTTDGNDPTTLSSYVDASSSWQFIVTTEGQFIIKYFGIDTSVNSETVKTATNILKIDKTIPTATSVSILSNNSNTSLAKEGNTITLSFTTSEPVTTPTVTIAGKTATVTNVSGNDYTATYTLTAAETQGVAAIAVDLSDIAGNKATQVIATTDSSSVTIDTVSPTPFYIARPSDNEVIESATTNAEGSCETGTTIAISGAALETNPTTTTCAGGQFLTPITFTSASLDTTFSLTFTQTDAAGNTNVKTINNIQYKTKVVTSGGSGPANTDFVPANTSNPPAPNPNPTQPTNNTPTPNNNPTNSPETPAPTPTTPETTPTPESTPTTPTENIAPQANPEENNTPTPIAPVTGGGTATPTGGTTGPAFNPADATLDIGGAGTAEETPAAEEAPTVNPTLDVGGGVTPEETSYTLLWTLLGLIALLNTWWFFVAKNKTPTMHRRD